jgi:hypothetical protein
MRPLKDPELGVKEGTMKSTFHLSSAIAVMSILPFGTDKFINRNDIAY